ncbi:TonB-dependent receptor [Bacteroides sp. 51]|uniref:SusC/RagA family TonB-linked outer membrane protein n=1 Tax=Bacteroides sp. 51 TaxID=2302938 RepID=UPI0013D3248C|nr:TonB-dependent receptor [Bacteroides sp. 51]NDV81642.1 TonB-dependent receptor [Bacteroides sp. 51]
MEVAKRKRTFLRPFFLLMVGLFFSVSVWAQQTTVRGTVKDATGEPVIGANVLVKGTSVGSITDYNGNYQITGVDPQKDILEFSFIGYKAIEVACNGKTQINVTLLEDTELLDEVVVIGYGQVRKSDATGSLSSVKADPSVRGLAPNAQDMLVGKIAGVQVTNGGGSPSSGATIRIRGGSSLSASNDPLIIVDGVPLDNQGIGGVGNMLSAINPTDIESFTVLKDASATAIYGSRASNGVIMITTRKGSSGKPRITYDGNVSVGVRVNEVDVLSGDEFRAFVQETFTGATNYDEVMGKLGTANTDWQDEIFRTAVSTEHNLSVYGSIKDALPYRVSAGYTNLNGILKTSNMERYTASIMLTPSLFQDHLKLNLNGKGMYIKNRFANQGSIGAAVAMDPTKPVYDTDSPYGGFYTWTGTDGNILGVATKNPVSMLELSNDESEVYNFIGSAQFDYKVHFLPELRLNLNLGLDYSSSEGGKYIPEFAPTDFLNGGYDGNWEQTRRNSLLDFYAQYAKDLNFLSSRFDVMGGYSWQHYWRKGNNHDYRISKFDEEGNPEVVSINSYETENYLVSFFGRLNYTIKDKYLFTFTLRNDGSSRFHEDNRWGLFPSAALAWRVINEDFLKDSKVVSDLKLRLGWGVTGQQDINQGDYPYLGRYQYAVGNQTNYISGYNNGTPNWISVMRPTSFNPDLKWESTTTYNIGIDYGFWNNRISGALDVYYRKTKDLINAETKVAAGTNFGEYVVANIGSLKNIGTEFSVNVIAIDQKDWKWEIGGNFAYNKNEIIELSYGDNKNALRRYGNTGGDGGFQLMAHSVGNPAGMYYVYEQIYDTDGKPIEGLYKDRNNDGQINENDLYLHHKPTPDWTFGLNTKLTWKAWDLSVAGHGSIGNYNYNAIAANNAEVGAPRVYANEFLSNRVKTAFDTNFQTKKVLSDYYVQDASFFRIDNITLGWSFKKIFKAPLSGRVYGSVQNPVVFTKYDGLDPEVSGGVDNDFYPRPLTMIFGVNINF